MTAAHQQFAARHVIVMAAPNGARRGHDDHAALPVTPREIADCAADLLDAGVSVLHLHVRDRDGQHTLDADCYRTAMRHIRRRVGNNLILQVTTEAVGRYQPDEQMAMVRDVKPEAVSIALRELCPDAASETVASGFFHWAVRERIWSQVIVYSPDELVRFDTLRWNGLFGEEHPFCLLVLGRYADGQPGDPAELHRMLGAVDCSSFPWATCCFGGREHEAMTVALEQGGHARVGFENNLLLADGRPARDNAELVSQFVAAVKASPRIPACADDIRGELLGRAP
ncbi:MAG: 3-keto-5-aminohexanoate cleavage protein [Woeseia sp.]